MTQADLFAPRAITELAHMHADQLSAEFLEWLPENLHVWKAFEVEALKLVRKGVQHYSSYTIVEFLRHHTAISEQGGEFKINNNYRPYLPRLFDLAHPQHVGLFEYRVTTKKKGA